MKKIDLDYVKEEFYYKDGKAKEKKIIKALDHYIKLQLDLCCFMDYMSGGVLSKVYNLSIWYKTFNEAIERAKDEAD